MTIEFRPHHFLCALCFQGSGYSPRFIENFSAIMQKLNSPSGDNTVIKVVETADSICSPCPNRRGVGCTEQTKISTLDKSHAEILNLSAGDNITWGQAKNRIAAHMKLEDFEQACAPCEWKKLGICETVLKEFNSSRP